MLGLDQRCCVQDLAVCWNGCFRRIFGHNRYEPLKDIQFFSVLSYHYFEFLYDLQQWKFLILVSHVPVALRTLFTFNHHVLRDLTLKYGHTSSIYFMKRVVFFFIFWIVTKLEVFY